jgi:hypothetical protein
LCAPFVVAFLVSGSAIAAPPKAPARGGRAPQAAEAEKKEEAEAKPESPPEARRPESKPSGTPATQAAGVKPNVVETQEDKEGVKTYKFGAVEVEGRLRSPQILYFLRRMRAEFAAGELGHRSFMLELSHTRHGQSFR